MKSEDLFDAYHNEVYWRIVFIEGLKNSKCERQRPIQAHAGTMKTGPLGSFGLVLLVPHDCHDSAIFTWDVSEILRVVDKSRSGDEVEWVTKGQNLHC